MYVRVFHDVEQDEHGRNLGFYGWSPEHGMALVFAYYERDDQEDLDACERAFRVFNIGHDPDFGTPHPLAIEYRRRRNRSLSVGDVVAVNDRFYHCADVGWVLIERNETSPIRQHPLRVSNVSRHGSTLLSDDIEPLSLDQ